ncbi:RICIN domain-containing protein [Kitasatospora sp. NPDC002227]|uniref:RICIN domain-containing protein n=1 Tax=Kitasatospora sp. NPDC002227 TaxID=3154773 RepID=UPI00332D6518
MASKSARPSASALPAVAPAADPARGLVYTGLRPAPAGDRCVGLYRVSHASLCTHGPDVPPKGIDVHKDTPPIAPVPAKAPNLGVPGAAAPSTGQLLTAARPVVDARTGQAVASPPQSGTTAAPAAADGSAVVCDGDGVTGNRVQVMYVHAPGQDRLAQYLPSFKQWAAGTDAIYNASAAQTGGVRHIRFVTEPDCTVSVLDVELPTGTPGDFGQTNDTLAGLGYNRTDRKYMMFTDAQMYCGIGTMAGDEAPGPENRSNFGPSYARADSGCWNSFTLAHELGHNLGAVNNSAPHSTHAGHCTDTNDVMCYSDAPNYPQMQVLCPDETAKTRLDCSKDDYFNTSPKPGSYLSTHWNIANNAFLIAGGGAGPTPDPNPTPTPGPAGATGPDATASEITENSAVLGWPAVDGAAGYQTQLGGQALPVTQVTSIRLVNLQPDTDYTFTVAVTDSAGHASAPGHPAVFHTPPAGGTALPATPVLLVNSLTGQAADLWSGRVDDTTPLIADQRTGYANQQWTFEDAGAGAVRLRSAVSGKCLTPAGPLAPGQYVDQAQCDASRADQRWTLTRSGNGYTLTAPGGSLVLGPSNRWYYGGWLLELQSPNQNGYQNWTLQSAG